LTLIAEKLTVKFGTGAQHHCQISWQSDFYLSRNYNERANERTNEPANERTNKQTRLIAIPPGKGKMERQGKGRVKKRARAHNVTKHDSENFNFKNMAERERI